MVHEESVNLIEHFVSAFHGWLLLFVYAGLGSHTLRPFQLFLPPVALFAYMSSNPGFNNFQQMTYHGKKKMKLFQKFARPKSP